MANESFKLSHLVDYSPDSDDPSIDPVIACRLLAKALLAVCAKLDADAGVTDVNYASTTTAVEYTGA